MDEENRAINTVTYDEIRRLRAEHMHHEADAMLAAWRTNLKANTHRLKLEIDRVNSKKIYLKKKNSGLCVQCSRKRALPQRIYCAPCTRVNKEAKLKRAGRNK